MIRRLESAERRLAEAAERVQKLNAQVEACVRQLDAAREQAEAQRELAADSAERAKKRAAVTRSLKTRQGEAPHGNLDDAGSDAVMRHIFGSFERVRGK